MEKEQPILQDTPHHSFRRHPDTEALIRHLRNCPVGTLVTYAELDTVIGRCVRKAGLLDTVRRALEAEQCFLHTEPKMGLRRVDHGDHSDTTGATARKKSARLFRRASHSLSHVIAEKLTPDQRVRLATNQTLIGLHEVLSQHKAVETVRTLCDAQGQRLMLTEAVQAIKEIL